MDLPAALATISADPVLKAVTTLAATVIVAGFFDVIGWRFALRLTRRTKSNLDDRLVRLVHRPAAFTMLLVGTWFAVEALHPADWAQYFIHGLFISAGATYWTVVALRGTVEVLDSLSRDGSVVQSRTRPLFELVLRIFVIGGGIYFLFIAWQINVTAWLASAGIVGIAVGFAAQDTLANLFAGLSILVDRPYKIGDYLILDQTTRGRVTEIGMRSTRMLTRDDVEVIIPNSQMASARIINESGGPYERERVSAVVSVVYGSDLDKVQRVLLACAAACPDVVHHELQNAPKTRVRELGDNGIVIHLLVWIPLPELRGRVLDDLYTRIYKSFRRHRIEFAYPTRMLFKGDSTAHLELGQVDND